MYHGCRAISNGPHVPVRPRAPLVEHTEKDRYWGDGGGPGKGQNRMGALLMEVRREIRGGRVGGI